MKGFWLHYTKVKWKLIIHIYIKIYILHKILVHSKSAKHAEDISETRWHAISTLVATRARLEVHRDSVN